jgi:protein SCO1/2
MRFADLNVRRVARAGALLLTIAALAVLAVFGLLHMLSVPPDADAARMPYPPRFDGPRLQSAPQLDEKRYREEKRRALGTRVPLEDTFSDSEGRQVRLADYFGSSRPVVLVLGYYRCPQLCGLLMHGLLEALHDDGIARRGVRIVGVSIDPEDTPASARVRRDADLAYADMLEGARGAEAPLDLHLLSGDARQLARRVGFGYRRDEVSTEARYAHDTGVVVLTPRGRVSSQLTGLRFDPGELRQALDDARHEHVGSMSDRLALLCAHFDPRFGLHSAAVMDAVRALALLVPLGLALWLWRRGPRAGDAP